MEWEEIVSRIITVSEAAVMFDKDRTTIMYAIWRGRVRAEQSAIGGTWLIDRVSCVEFWGKPVKEVTR